MSKLPLIVLAVIFIVFPLRVVLFSVEIVPNIPENTATPKYDIVYSSTTLGVLGVNVDGRGPPTHTLGGAINNYNSKKLDLYKENVNACEDFYSKVCSLYDDPLYHVHGSEEDEDEDESSYTTGTFKDMIQSSTMSIRSIIDLSFRETLQKCLNDEGGDPGVWLRLVDGLHIKSFYDVWLHGADSLLEIDLLSKFYTGPHFAVELRASTPLTELFSNDGSEEGTEEVRNTLLALYSLLGGLDNDEPVYKNLTELNPTFSRLLKSKLRFLNDDSLVLVSPLEERYLEECFVEREDFGSKVLFALLLRETLISSHKNCYSLVRDIHFYNIAAKYYRFTEVWNYANDLESLVKRILLVAERFFNNLTRVEFEPLWEAYNRSGRELFLGMDYKEETRFYAEKMQKVKVISMPSVPEEIVREFEKREESELRGGITKEEEWQWMYFISMRNRNSALIDELTDGGGGGGTNNYLQLREDTLFWQRFTWITVQPETVNAWYNPLFNTITVPIGITRYPMYRSDPAYDTAFLASILGHEIGHATDSSGRDFDSVGNYKANRWRGGEEVFQRMKCLTEDYGSACGNENYGRNTLGEDMADQFGLRIILLASVYKLVLESGGGELNLTSSTSPLLVRDKLKEIYSSPIRNDFLLEKKVLFRELFVNFARIWCGRNTYKQECKGVQSDVHAMAKHRVTKTLRQFEIFRTVFECSERDPMVNEGGICMIY